MNKENIVRLIEFVSASETYDQAEYAHHCGSPACLAGHAVAMEGADSHIPLFERFEWRGFYHTEATRILGLTADEADAMFDIVYCYGGIRKAHAIEVLKLFLETGEVNWNEARIRVREAEKEYV